MVTAVTKVAFFSVFFILIVLPGVHADLTISEAKLQFGGSSQEKFGEGEKLLTLSKTFTVVATAYYKNVALSFSSQNNFQLTLPSINQTLNSSLTTLNISITIPDDFDAVDDDLDKKEFEIGTITLTGQQFNETNDPIGSPVQDTLQLFLEIKNQLELNKIELQKEDGSVVDITSSSTVEVEAQDVEFIFYIKNTFSNNTQVEFSDVDIIVDIEDNGDDSLSISDIEAGETASENVDFNLDEAGNFKVKVLIKGTDEFGGVHGLEKEFTLDVNPAPEEPEDSDGDGVADGQDQCGGTPTYCTVNSQGCSLDKDNDGVCDAIDAVDNTAPQQQPESEKEDTQVQTTQQGKNTPGPVAKETTTHISKKSEDGGSQFLPFLFGFIAGVVVATGFFFLLRS